MSLNTTNLQPRALLAELLGTFLLAVIVVTVANPLIVGFAIVVLTFALGTVSGAHLNPAVTLGLWSVRKIEGLRVPLHWAMQFLGAVLALLVVQMYQKDGYGIAFSSFGQFDMRIVVAELLGTAAFVFAFTAAAHKQLEETAKAFCVGLGLLTGLAVGGGLLGVATSSATGASTGATPRITKIDGAVLNPAVALAASEKSEQQSQLGQLGSTPTQADTKRPASRFTLETLVGGLVGGALGANLYMVTVGVNPFKKKETVATKVTKVIRKGTKKGRK